MDTTAIKKFISGGFSLEQSLTQTGMALWSIVLCTRIENVIMESDQKAYLLILKTIKKKRPDLHATDKAGRSCFHFAASAGNTIGLKFAVQLLLYLEEKETG